MSREAFERYARADWPEIDLSVVDGEYRNTKTRDWWTGWQLAVSCCSNERYVAQMRYEVDRESVKPTPLQEMAAKYPGLIRVQGDKW
jgi:hypothetical protein